MDFRLPALGEGIDSATVVGVRVKPGDTVTAGQEVIDIETDKAAMAVPVEEAGTVEAVLVKPGDKVPVGSPLLKLTGGGGDSPAASPAKPAEVANSMAPSAKTADEPEPPPAAHSGGGQVEFKLPALGEGIDGATVVGVRVKPGDAVTTGQEVIDVETDKAAMAVPVETAGTVEAVHVKTGDKVRVGGPLLTLTGSAAAAKPQPVQAEKPLPASQKPKPTPTKAPSGSNGAAAPPATDGKKTLVPAGPATRRLARELGVALAEIAGSARGGRVTLDDVKGHVRNRLTQAPTGGANTAGSIVDAFVLPPLPDFGRYGEVERKSVSGIRKKIAENLTVAWRTMPMVTQHDDADITDLEAGRKRIVEGLPKNGPKVTMTVLAVKAVVAALREFPHFNASYDMNAGELVLKKYFHVGIAVDTERGLVVPVVRDADRKSVRDLAAEVAALAEKARSGKLAVDEMRGGTFTITNLGGIGGTAFTPIVNYPEVAILGLSRSVWRPVIRDGQVVPRLLMPMSLTYDHRVIDGADGARFIVRLAQLFSDPIRLLMES